MVYFWALMFFLSVILLIVALVQISEQDRMLEENETIYNRLVSELRKLREDNSFLNLEIDGFKELINSIDTSEKYLWGIAKNNELLDRKTGVFALFKSRSSARLNKREGEEVVKVRYIIK